MNVARTLSIEPVLTVRCISVASSTSSFATEHAVAGPPPSKHFRAATRIIAALKSMPVTRAEAGKCARFRPVPTPRSSTSPCRENRCVRHRLSRQGAALLAEALGHARCDQAERQRERAISTDLEVSRKARPPRAVFSLPRVIELRRGLEKRHV